MEKVKNNNFIKVILIISLCIFTVCIINKTFQNDTFTVISEGNRILNNGFDKECGEYIFFVIIAIIYNSFDFFGIYIFTIFLSIIISLSIFYILQKRNVNIVLSFLMTIFITYTLRDTLTARAQILSFIVLIWEYHFINRLIETNKKYYSIFIIILGIIMVNIHAPLYPIYIIMFLPYVAQIIVSKLKKIINQNDFNKIIIEKTNSEKLFIITFLISIFAGLITPLNKSIAYFGSVNFIEEGLGNYILEMQPLVITNNFIYFIIIFIAISILLLTKTKIRIVDSLFLLGFGILSLVVLRNLIYFILFGSISITILIDNFLCDYKIYEIKINSKIKCLILFFTIMIILLYGINIFIRNLNNDYCDTEFCPVYACNFLLENYDIDKIKIYNSFNTGAYINFRGIPAFITSANADNKRMQDFVDVENNKIHYNEIFDEYGITHILTENLELAVFIENDGKYKIIYQDEIYYIFEKI